jgi:5'-nucleotidase
MPMRILVDMDGVLADFDLPIWEWAQERGFRFNCDAVSAEGRAYYLTENLEEEWQRVLMRKHIERTSYFRELPEVPGAIEGVQRLIREGHDVWICTKPLEANLNCRDDKAFWLRQRLPELEHKLILTPDKSLIKADILLDDAIRPDWAAVADWNPVIYSQAYNGPGTPWENWPHWSWDQSVEELLIAGLQDRTTFL